MRTWEKGALIVKMVNSLVSKCFCILDKLNVDDRFWIFCLRNGEARTVSLSLSLSFVYFLHAVFGPIHDLN